MLFGKPLSSGDVFGPDAGGQTKDTVVGKLDCFVFGLEGHDRQHRPKSFVAHDRHVVIDVGQHGRLVEEPVEICSTLSAGQASGRRAALASLT